jgi:hypothetical protein
MRGMTEAFVLGLLFVAWVFFFGFSCSLITRIFKQPEYRYQNLHALEYPAATSDLSTRTFSTPALPMRLASAWEIEDVLKLTHGALASAYTMVYPLVERPTDKDSAFTYTNALNDAQTQFYCPKRGETLEAWMTRTKQTANADITAQYNANKKFNINSEHSDVCRASRPAPMVLAHVAARTFTLFSEQNSTIMLMYAAIVNAIFLSVIIIDRWRGFMYATAGSISAKMKYASWFAILFFVLSLLALVPLLADYVYRNDGVVLTETSSTSGNRAVGSYVLGIWTILFSFVYVYIMPAMNVVLHDSAQEIEAGNTKSMQEVDKSLLRNFFRRHPLTALAYWNLLLTPCLVMVVITSNAYGIDTNLQFIMYCTVAIGVLDVLHARVNLITRMIQRINVQQKTVATEANTIHEDHINVYFEIFVYVVFLVMKLVIAMPVIVKMQQANMDVFGLGVVVVAFIGPLTLHSVEFMFVCCHRSTLTTYSKTTNPDAEDKSYKYQYGLFEVCLGMQLFFSIVMFACACLTRRISA